MITGEFNNLRDSVSLQLSANKNKTLLELRNVSVRKSLSHAMRNRRYRNINVQSSAATNKDRLKAQRLTGPQRIRFMRETIDARNEDRASSFEELLLEWPVLKKYEGIATEYRLMKKLKNLDYIGSRVSRALSNFQNIMFAIIKLVISRIKC